MALDQIYLSYQISYEGNEGYMCLYINKICENKYDEKIKMWRKGYREMWTEYKNCIMTSRKFKNKVVINQMATLRSMFSTNCQEN